MNFCKYSISVSQSTETRHFEFKQFKIDLSQWRGGQPIARTSHFLDRLQKNAADAHATGNGDVPCSSIDDLE